MTFIDASAPIVAHAAITQNVHGVGANDIADVADISTHAAVSTNVHGTGAGNVVAGNDELTEFVKDITLAAMQANPATGTIPIPARFNDGDTTLVAVWENIGEYAEINFDGNNPYFITQYRIRGHTDQVEDGRWTLQHYKSGVWIDNTVNIPTFGSNAWTSWINITTPISTTKIRWVATTIDTGGTPDKSKTFELELR